MDSRAFSPPIQSIWIEEDQFMEKIYGFQVNQLLDAENDKININDSNIFKDADQHDDISDIHSNSDYNMKEPRILIINSDTPHLDNKNNISLGGNTTEILEKGNKNSNSTKLRGKQNVSLPKRLLHALRTNHILTKMKSHVDKNPIPNISVPFQFQHISHGENQITENLSSDMLSSATTHDVTQADDNNNDTYDDTTEATIFSTMTTKTSAAFSAFCTPKLNSSSVNSSKIFDLERRDDLQSLSSPTTLVANSIYGHSIHH